jgi:DNA topoisomerase-1
VGAWAGAGAGPRDEAVDAVGLKGAVAAHLSEIDAREINSIPLGTGDDGQEIVARVGRYGPYLQRGDDRASIPDNLAPDELTVARAEEILAAPSNDRVLGTDPESGLEIALKAGRFGPYVQVGELVDGAEKPRTASLFSSMEPATLTLEQALELLRIPRTVGTDPGTGEDIVAHNGRFGPYLKRGSDTRSLASEDQLLRVTIDEALALFAQPKQRRGATAAPPLRELGADPATNLPVVVKEGRFGPYVTDGTTNASLRKGDSVESIVIDRASELLAERRAAGPSTRKKAAKKAVPAKRAPAKKAAKKSPAKRAPAKKAAPAKEAAAEPTADLPAPPPDPG